MIRAITSARGKPAIEDKNHFRYTANGGNTEVSWFRERMYFNHGA